MKNKLYIILTSIILINLMLVSAIEDPTFQHNNAFDLKRGCSDLGFFCDSSFNCNITLIYPDGTILRDNQLMTDATSYRNITIVQSENNQLGFIKAIQSCNNGTSAGLETFDIAITADGKKFQVFPTQFPVILLGFLFIILGIVTTNERLRLFKHIGSLILLVMGVVTLYPGYSFINWSNLMGKSIGFSLIALGFYFLIEDSFSRSEQSERFQQDFEERER